MMMMVMMTVMMMMMVMMRMMHMRSSSTPMYGEIFDLRREINSRDSARDHLSSSLDQSDLSTGPV